MNSMFYVVTTLTLQETRNIHDFMNIQKIEFIAYILLNKSLARINKT